MSGDDGKKSGARPERSTERAVLSPNTISSTHYLKTLPDVKKGGQGGGNQPDDASGSSSGSQGSEKNIDDKS